MTTQPFKFEKVRRLASTEILPPKVDKVVRRVFSVIILYMIIHDIVIGEMHWLYGVLPGALICISLVTRGFRRTFSWLYTDQPDKPDKPGDQR